ncbi:MAG: hypothetical protein AAF840_18305, partial [Bacteroidota bacterium]
MRPGVTYTPTKLQQTTDYYRVVRSGGCSVATNEVTITVEDPPPAPIARGASRCGPGTVTLSFDLPGGQFGLRNFQWYEADGTPIPGETSRFYTTPSLTTTTTYLATLENALGCQSAPISITAGISTPPEAAVIGADFLQYCFEGTRPTVSVLSAPTGLTY